MEERRRPPAASLSTKLCLAYDLAFTAVWSNRMILAVVVSVRKGYLYGMQGPHHLYRPHPSSESTVQMVPLRIWIALSPLLTTTLGLSGADSGLRKRGVVGTGYASYRGVNTYGDVISYLGIPYAEPPLGDLRFRAPKALNVTRAP